MSYADHEPLVSIVIPVYNAERYLEQSLRSVMNQTYRTIEIICVNDGSTDSSPNILQRLKEEDFRIQIATSVNKGAASARNIGMDIALGDYILFFDADDLLDKKAVGTLVKSALKNDTDIVLFDYYKFSDTGKIRTRNSAKVLRVPMDKVISPTAVADRLFQADNGMPWNKFFKREFLRKTHIHFQDLRNTEDEYFSRLTTVTASRILFLNKKFVGYRVGNEQSLRENVDQNILDCTYALKAIRDDLKSRGYYETYRETYRKLAGYIVMLRLLAAYGSESFITLATEISNNTLTQCEVDVNHLEEQYIDAYRALLSKDISAVKYEFGKLG